MLGKVIFSIILEFSRHDHFVLIEFINFFVLEMNHCLKSLTKLQEKMIHKIL